LLQWFWWIYRPAEWLDRCGREFPNAFKTTMPGSPLVVMLTQPELIAELFALSGDVAAAGKGNAILRPVVGDHSLILLDGQEHAHERKLMMPAFHGERMRAYAETIRDITEQALATWPIGQPFALHAMFQELTLEVIFRVVLGVSKTEETQALRASLRALLEFSQNPSLLLALKQDGTARAPQLQSLMGRYAPDYQFRHLCEEADRHLFAELHHRRSEKGERDDILSMLMAARDEQGRPMTDAELRDQVITLLVAGHETTATSLSWAIAELISHPEVLARARAELSAEVGSASLQASHLPKLRYVDAVLSETLRLRPVLPIVARILLKPIQLGPYSLPKDTFIAPCIYLAHRSPDRYPEPEAFKPERFLDGPADPSAYFPFGGGARRCIGRAFALFEMKVVLAQLLPRLDLQFAPGYQPRLIRRSITFAPDRGVPVVAQLRH
jgi:cytochrome P450